MMNYTEVKFSFQPFDNIYPELLSASLAEIGFDTFHNEGETLLAYTPSGTISNEEIEDVINAFFIPVEFIRRKSYDKVVTQSLGPIQKGNVTVVQQVISAVSDDFFHCFIINTFLNRFLLTF